MMSGVWILDTWENRRSSVVLRMGVSDEWRFQLVAYLTAVDPRFGDVADDVARRTTPHLLSDLPAGRLRGESLLDAVCSHFGLHQEQTVTLDHGHTEPRRTRSTAKT